MNPITSATVSGLGQTFLIPVEGTWVVGFFSDAGEAQQNPIIMGTLFGVPTSLPTKDGSKGFQDRLNGNYPKYKNETDVNRNFAVNDTRNLPHPNTYSTKSG